MKKIYTLIFAAIALIAFVPSAYAQKPYEDDGSGICYSKKVSEPDPDGVYTITLESFVTGSVTIKNESVPADIVLVLDLSQSMTQGYNGGTRLGALQTALESFLEVIYHNDKFKDKTNDNPREEPLGNRISIVTFAGQRTNTSNNVTQIRSGLTPVTNSDGTKNTNIISYIMGLTTRSIDDRNHQGTYSDDGMRLANSVLADISSDRKEKASRTVVLFTDGAPGQGPDWTTGTGATNSSPTSTRCIAQAYIAKNTHTATVFTVILGDYPTGNNGQLMRNYLAYTSSNYLNAQSLTDDPGQLNPKVDPSDASTSFAKEAGADLSGVFTTIAEASGGSDKDLTDATVSNVDIVSASFMLPPGTDATKIKLYTAKYLGTKDAEGYMQFGEKVLKGSSTDTYRKREKDEHGVVHFVGEPILVDSRLTASLEASVAGGKKDKIVVNGFDYANNFCGEDSMLEAGYNGHKVIIEIPIMMDPEAVGGPDVDTNGPESGIYINGENVIKFKSPEVSLPVNIHIRKTGLKVGESAKFTIQRKYVKDSDAGGSNPWVPVTSVFVTRHDGDAEEGVNAPMTKVMGMPSTDSADRPYVYRIVEDDWSWSYDSLPLTPTTTDLLETNPFIFQNAEKDNIDVKVRHAESKATNTFHPDKTKVKYDDSKARKTD